MTLPEHVAPLPEHVERGGRQTTIIEAFLLGLIECQGGVGMTYNGDSGSSRSEAYDTGRALGWHLLGIK